MAAEEMPDAEWWLKADACDVTAGLMESVRGKWSGDVDLGDGALQQLKAKLQSQLAKVEALGLVSPRSIQLVLQQLRVLKTNLAEELDFITKGTFFSWTPLRVN